MEETRLPTDLANLRPHHALCLLFFEGKGYSQGFSDNMAAFIAKPNQMVQIMIGCDVLCQACPHNQDGFCDDEAKVKLFDQRTMNLTGIKIKANHVLQVSQLTQTVYDMILRQGLLAEVCGECEWAALCQGKWLQGDFNRSLLKSSQPA